jgi:prophage DNA circulation protein
VQPQATQPALVLAYSLYEDASRDADIIARNNVRHPGFVPGGRTLEVLADA